MLEVTIDAGKGDEAEQLVLNQLRHEIEQRVAELTCLEHQVAMGEIVLTLEGDDLHGQVRTCCETFAKEVERAIEGHLARSEEPPPTDKEKR